MEDNIIVFSFFFLFPFSLSVYFSFYFLFYFIFYFISLFIFLFLFPSFFFLSRIGCWVICDVSFHPLVIFCPFILYEDFSFHLFYKIYSLFFCCLDIKVRSNGPETKLYSLIWPRVMVDDTTPSASSTSLGIVNKR